MSKNVAVFVDVANIFYAAKAAGVDIDYVTLLKASSAGRDLVRAYAYTGLDPDNENQRNFHDFLRRHGYKVVSKDIRKYGDGKVKANLDIELVVDMMKTARNLDIAIVVSGDGDFAPAIRAVQEQGVRVEVVSFRGNTSSDLMDVADQFTDITQIAKVEKGSSRSGRRVADDDADLSMTEVPDKQSEGTGDRARGRGRTRRTATGTATTATAARGRGRAAVAASREASNGEASLVVLPGEKLSRAAAAPAAPAPLEDDIAGTPELAAEGEDAATREEALDDGPRRRRRRGGRGRGRGRAREDEQLEPTGRDAAAAPADHEPDEEEAAPRPPRRPSSAFGSIWDSQIGVPAAGRAVVPNDDEDLEEPEIPEYLLTERRQRDAARSGRGGGGRGRGGAYAAALDRERYGGGRGSTPSRFAEAPRREGGYGRPDRERGGRNVRDDRSGFRDARPPRTGGDEPWSEVPPEIEAMLRAQMGSRPARPEAPARPASRSTEEPVQEEVTATASGPDETQSDEKPRPARGSRSRRTSTASETPETASTEDAEAPAAQRGRGRTRKSAASADPGSDAGAEAEAAAPARTRSRTAKAATSRTTTRRTRSTTAETSPDDAGAAPTADAADTVEPAEKAAPKRRAPRRKAEPAA